MEFLEQFDLPTDDLPGVLRIAEHDALVHDDPLGGLHLLPPGHSDDVEVRAEEGGGGLVVLVEIADWSGTTISVPAVREALKKSRLVMVFFRKGGGSQPNT